MEEGKLTTLVILDGNPLKGYWNLMNAKVVIKRSPEEVGSRSLQQAPIEIGCLTRQIGLAEQALDKLECSSSTCDRPRQHRAW